jgi:hypothetical protein
MCSLVPHCSSRGWPSTLADVSWASKIEMSMIGWRNSWKRAGGFDVVSAFCFFYFIGVGVLGFAHSVECWKCRKEMAVQMARAEKISYTIPPLAKPGDVTYIYDQKYVWDGWKWKKAERQP